MKRLSISIVVPAFNEALGIEAFARYLDKTLCEFDYEWNYLFVDDGSEDATWQIISKLDISNFRAIRLEKNSGHQAALEAGIAAATGDWIVTIDADFQHPAELIPIMLDKALTDDLEVIQSIRIRGSEERKIRTLGAFLFYRLIARNTKLSRISDAGDFRLISRKVAEKILHLNERDKVLRFLIPSLGFRVGYIEYKAKERLFGESKYSWRKLFSLGISSLVGFSTFPLKVLQWIAVIITSITSVYSIVVINQYVQGNRIQGWTSLILSVLIMSSLQFSALAVLGRYLAQLLDEVRQRPKFIVREISHQ